MLDRDVVDGVHRISEYFVNWYLVEEDGWLTVVDAGLPASWRSFQDALNAIGRAPGDVEALVLTHAHFDHMGFAEWARSELGIPVWVHENDAPLTRRPWLYMTERSPLSYDTRGPRIVARGATADSERALASLKRIARTGAGTLLPGHGEPWRDGAERGAGEALRVGVI